MKTRVLVLCFVLCFFQGNLKAQKTVVEKGGKRYEDYAYIDVIKMYERIAAKGYRDAEMFKRLGNSYFFNAEYEKAEPIYKELFAMNPSQAPVYYYRYAQCLKSVGKYEEAEKMLGKFSDLSTKEKVSDMKTDRDYLESIQRNSGRFRVDDAGINSLQSDYGTAYFGNKIVFATARDTGGFSKSRHSWNDRAFTNLYAASMKDSLDSIPGNPYRLSKLVNSRFHESTPAFTKDGKTMYFTRNDYLDGKRGKDAKKITRLKIYKATMKDTVWTDITELPFNSSEFSTAHPALSPDEKTLYFASDRPGTFGDSDIYKVSLDGGAFGEPTNLGPVINSAGRDTFPFVAADGALYFASDGHPGLGGLDIFVTNLSFDGAYKAVDNLGMPLNSHADDFGFVMNDKTRKGFFTSNRVGGKGSDDIYRFTELKQLKCEQLLEGIIVDQETKLPLTDATVELYNDKMEKVKTVQTDQKGYYNFGYLDCGSKVNVRVSKPDFETAEWPVEIGKSEGSTYLPITIGKRIVKIEKGTDLARADVLNIPMIYFDLDKSDITPKAAFELEKILAVLEEYPSIKIDVRSHTDSRQTHRYNQALSERRAKSTIAWLVQNGVDAARITGRGYGETRLVNGCSDGVPCTEEEHQKNRRSEFIVMDF